MKGILMTPANHKATRELRKTMTRRLDGLKVINQNPNGWKYITNAIRDISPLRIGDCLFENSDKQQIWGKPRYRVGETVYIKEAWATDKMFDNMATKDIENVGVATIPLWYKCWDSQLDREGQVRGRWRSPLFLPAWAARDFITITDVKPERLQDITEEDALAEGITIMQGTHQAIEKDPETGKLKLVGEPQPYTARYHFEALWDSINGKTYPWESNPWVWAYTYELVDRRE